MQILETRQAFISTVAFGVPPRDKLWGQTIGRHGSWWTTTRTLKDDKDGEKAYAQQFHSECHFPRWYWGHGIDGIRPFRPDL